MYFKNVYAYVYTNILIGFSLNLILFPENTFTFINIFLINVNTKAEANQNQNLNFV